MVSRSVIQAELEVARFLATRPTPAAIVSFKPSDDAAARFYELVDTERDGSIDDATHTELDSYLCIEHLMRLVKAEAC